MKPEASSEALKFQHDVQCAIRAISNRFGKGISAASLRNLVHDLRRRLERRPKTRNPDDRRLVKAASKEGYEYLSRTYIRHVLTETAPSKPGELPYLRRADGCAFSGRKH